MKIHCFDTSYSVANIASQQFLPHVVSKFSTLNSYLSWKILSSRLVKHYEFLLTIDHPINYPINTPPFRQLPQPYLPLSTHAGLLPSPHRLLFSPLKLLPANPKRPALLGLCPILPAPHCPAPASWAPIPGPLFLFLVFRLKAGADQAAGAGAA